MLGRIDYEKDILIGRIKDHGPIFDTDMHSRESLLAFGNSHYIIHLYDYKQKKYMIKFPGHSGPIRTVQFHHNATYNCLVSASDDFTVRIWDFIRGVCILLLSEHTDSVTCASFHPRHDHLLISASVDKTIRVWDVNGLLKAMPTTPTKESAIWLECCKHDYDEFNIKSKYTLQGHNRDVNWAAFHPTLPFILSASEEELILWSIYDSMGAVKAHSFRGHGTNFHQCASIGSDRNHVVSITTESIRIYNLSARTEMVSFNKEGVSRLKCLAVHPTAKNILAVGHMSGFTVFRMKSKQKK